MTADIIANFVRRITIRKTNDTKALNRKDGGIYESLTLTELAEGLNRIELPAIPTELKGGNAL